MLPKVRAFTADDLDIVSGIFTDIPVRPLSNSAK